MRTQKPFHNYRFIKFVMLFVNTQDYSQHTGKNSKFFLPQKTRFLGRFPTFSSLLFFQTQNHWKKVLNFG